MFPIEHTQTGRFDRSLSKSNAFYEALTDIYPQQRESPWDDVSDIITQQPAC